MAKGHQVILRKFPADINEFFDLKKAQLNAHQTEHLYTKQELIYSACREYMKKHPLDKARPLEKVRKLK